MAKKTFLPTSRLNELKAKLCLLILTKINSTYCAKHITHCQNKEEPMVRNSAVPLALLRFLWNEKILVASTTFHLNGISVFMSDEGSRKVLTKFLHTENLCDRAPSYLVPITYSLSPLALLGTLEQRPSSDYPRMINKQKCSMIQHCSLTSQQHDIST